MRHLPIDRRQIEVELPQVLGPELPGLELDDDVAAQPEVIEEQVDEEVLPPTSRDT